MAITKDEIARGEAGFKDDVPWRLTTDGTRYYIGSCGGCGCEYRTREWSLADQNACSGCYSEGWSAIGYEDQFSASPAEEAYIVAH